jgi:hypothetical protein
MTINHLEDFLSQFSELDFLSISMLSSILQDLLLTLFALLSPILFFHGFFQIHGRIK